MSEISDAIQNKCLAFGDRIIKLNDYLLEQAANKHQPSSFRHRTSRVPVHLQSVAALANQLLRSGTSIGANNAEAIGAISKADESLYWIDLLHRNGYLTDEQYRSIYADAEELVKVLTHRCKKLDGVE